MLLLVVVVVMGVIVRTHLGTSFEFDFKWLYLRTRTRTHTYTHTLLFCIRNQFENNGQQLPAQRCANFFNVPSLFAFVDTVLASKKVNLHLFTAFPFA